MIGDVTITAANTLAGRAEAAGEVFRRDLIVLRIEYPDPATAVYVCRPRATEPTGRPT